MATKSAPTDESATKIRILHGISVRFYKRTAAGNYTMDFLVMGERVQESTKWPTMANAERVAEKRVREMKERKQGLVAAGMAHQKAKGKYATVGEVMECLEGGDKIWSDGTKRAYRSALMRVARLVDEKDPLSVSTHLALSEATIEKLYATGQGIKGVNWVDALEPNGGLNSTVRNLKSMFTPRVIKIKFRDTKLPDLRPLREMPFLRVQDDGFIPWPVEVYDRMHAASEVMRLERPELWLVNAMLRRLGLRDEELLEARREWIEERYEFGPEGMGPPVRRAFLRVVDRGVEFSLLKHGAARVLELDEELMEILLPREGYLVGNDFSPSGRSDLIYRVHNKWLRHFIPDRVKGNHELRMHAGSIVYTLHGLDAAKVFLGHKSQATTERYYATWLSTSPKLDAKTVAQARIVKEVRMAA